MERRLAAVLAADVVGYTRLMGADEAGTLRRLTELREVTDLQTLTSALGTPGYMPPEAALGEIEKIDKRTDVYSLGAILHKILTGKFPF